MIERQRKTKNPCQKCFMHKIYCICSEMPHLHLKTKVTLVIHHKELKRPTNTGRLALNALENSQMEVRGQMGAPLSLGHLLNESFESVLFYPSEDAIELKELNAVKPVQLIVPDGSWRQAAKVNTRHPELKHLKRVKISAINQASQHIRKEHLIEGMSTLEAIARALEILEGPRVGEQMLQLYQAKLRATLKGRGHLISELR